MLLYHLLKSSASDRDVIRCKGNSMRPLKLILLVEHHFDSAELMSYILVKNGYRTVVAGTNERARNILSAITPHFVVLDRLASNASDSLLAELRRQGMATCTVLCSTQHDLSTFCKKEGVGFFIRKPFEIDEFVSVVQKADACATCKRTLSRSVATAGV